MTIESNISFLCEGTIKAATPTMITRPGQNGRLLTMTVVTNGTDTMRVPVIPGETIKGLLRARTFAVAYAAAKAQVPGIGSSLDKFYEQTLGGREFAKGDLVLGSQDALRLRQPILSLFGAANPRITGRLIIEAALSQLSARKLTDWNRQDGKKAAPGSGLLGGTRRDPLLVDPELTKLLETEDLEKWAIEAKVVSMRSAAETRLRQPRLRRDPSLMMKTLPSTTRNALRPISRRL